MGPADSLALSLSLRHAAAVSDGLLVTFVINDKVALSFALHRQTLVLEDFMARR